MNGLITSALVHSLIKVLVKEGVLSFESAQRVYTETVDALREVEPQSEIEAEFIAQTIARINEMIDEP
jgi:hypothetical protein